MSMRFWALFGAVIHVSFAPSFTGGFTLESDHRFKGAEFSETSGFTAAMAFGDHYFVGTSNRGAFESTDAGRNWQAMKLHEMPMRNDSANQRRVYSVDNRIRFLTHKHDILYKTPSAWKTATTNAGRAVVFTAIHQGKKNLYLGTSVSGLKVAALSEVDYQKAITLDKAMALKFNASNKGLPGKPHNASHFIFEEVQAIYETPSGDLIVATGPQIALYLKRNGKERFEKIAVNGLSENLDDCKTLTATHDGKIALSCNRGFWSGTLADSNWQFAALKTVAGNAAAWAKSDNEGNQWAVANFKQPVSAEKINRLKNASGHRLMYASAYTWKTREKKVLAELQSDLWTGLVIDGKDDLGNIRYDSTIEVAKKLGAIRPLYKMADVVEKVHALKKRVVVRLVIFKDHKLFELEGYAIRDAGGGKWVGTPKERWIDPYNPSLLTDYYAPMMKELTAMGVDEIQLDYIRFPSDGAVGRCRFPYKKSDYYFSEALENFLLGVREATPLPLGADVYGYNGMYRAPGAIGQDLEVYGRVLDVIAPMHYSSHFGDDFMRELPQTERAYALLKLALLRGSYIAQGSFILRPYIQAFPMKNGIWGYGKKYFADQMKGAADGGGDGFMFWGKLDHMTLVRTTQEKS